MLHDPERRQTAAQGDVDHGSDNAEPRPPGDPPYARLVTGRLDDRRRCDWGGEWLDERMRAYHDEEWGVPVHDEQRLFELVTLEGAQAGLSWSTILNRREGYRRAFAAFDPEVVAGFGEDDVQRLMADTGIVRNRAKILATIGNARATLALRDGPGLATHLWSFVGGVAIVTRPTVLGDLPAETSESKLMSRDLRRRGFSFVGPTICYALMQAAGLTNDHQVSCFRFAELASDASSPA
jgi:DNA-3-methyladenine glycosylase I